MHTLLVPLDGSSLAEHALPHARALAALTGAQICLLQVVPEQRAGSVYTPTLAEVYVLNDDRPGVDEVDHERVLAMLQNQAAIYLTDQVQALRSDVARVSSEVYVGDPAETIVEVAATMPNTWIVMATHGYSGLKRWTLGSVTDKVIHAASVPVLVVRSSAEAPPSMVQFRHILVPQDGSALAQQALPLAVELAQTAGANLTLVRAITPTAEIWTDTALMALPQTALTDIYQALHMQAQQELGALADDLQAQGLHVTTTVECAVAADAIIAATQFCNADLVVMATHGRSGIRRWALGSVADKVLHATVTPLLLVRAQPPH